MSDQTVFQFAGALVFSMGIGACCARLERAIRRNEPMAILAYGMAICLILRALIVLTTPR